MKATLIFNGNAGGANGLDVDELQGALSEAGYRPVCIVTAHQDELDEVLDDVEGLVVAAGGDGTVREIATRLIGRDVPLAVLPVGTANNIAGTFGIEGKTVGILKRLAEPEERWLDIGRVSAPWGEEFFLEGMGVGLYADVLAEYDPEQGKSVVRAAETIRKVVLDYPARGRRVLLDGEDISGVFVGLEALNTRAVGPRMRLAPKADPSDGLLDVVRVQKPDDVSLIDYLTSLMTDRFEELPNVEVLRGKRLELGWRGEPVHIDAEVRTSTDGELEDPETLEVEVLPGAVRLWLPSIE